MKSSTSRTTGNGGVYPNYTILFLLLLVMGDLGIQTNNRVVAGFFSRKKANKTEELTNDDDVNDVNEGETNINAEFAERTISLVKSVLESYELFNKAADTGMSKPEWTNLQNKMNNMVKEFKSINDFFFESITNEIIDSEMEQIYNTALENYYKLKDKLDTHNKFSFFKPYEPLEPENMKINATKPLKPLKPENIKINATKPLKPEDMHNNANSFESSGWWKKMSKTKKIALITSIAGIATLTGSISTYFGTRHSKSSDQDDKPKPANDLSMKQIKQSVDNERLIEGEVTKKDDKPKSANDLSMKQIKQPADNERIVTKKDDKPKPGNDLSMKQIKQPVDNERLVTKQDNQKSDGTAMLVVVLVIAMVSGLSLVTYLYVQHLRNQVGANAPSGPKSNNKSEGSTSSTITTENLHNNHHDKSSKKSKKKQIKSPKSNRELKSNSSKTN